jgi:hypothetical protein
MQLVTLDFETYYDVGFSLSGLTTEEYIRDARFQVIGVAIKIDEAETYWVTGSHEVIQEALNKIDWKNSALLCHNTQFDGAILAFRFGIIPGLYLDTLSMARATNGVEVGGSLAFLVEYYDLGVKGTEVVQAKGKRLEDFTLTELSAYASYCVNDVNLTYKLFGVLAPKFPQSEIDLIDLTLRMYTQPLLEVDDALLQDRLIEVQAEKSELLQGLMVKLECETEECVRAKLASNKQFAEILQELGVIVPTKISPATGKETFALAKGDQGFLDLCEHEDPFIQQLCTVRLGTKSTIEESRIERFIGIGSRNKGKLPIPLKYYGAHTGRWAGCLVDDTQVLVYNEVNGVETKKIIDVLLDDLVWDGEAFVEHEGVSFSGYAEVINWDGVKGTEDHVVYTDAGEISLREAMQGKHKITVARSPTENDVETARKFISNNKTKN